LKSVLENPRQWSSQSVDGVERSEQEQENQQSKIKVCVARTFGSLAAQRFWSNIAFPD
jgi:hypothetical protein